MKTFIRIAFVPTAGGRKEVYWKGIRLPFFFTWPPCKWFYRALGIKTKHLDRLKVETIARLEKAKQLFLEGKVDVVYFSGGLSHRKNSSTEMMKTWFIRELVESVETSLITPEKIVLDGETLQTSDKAEKFVLYLLGLCVQSYGLEVEIHVVTSWYHMKRCTHEIRGALAKHDVVDWSVKSIVSHRVYPPCSWECWMYEYLYNIVVEPFVRIASRSKKLRDWYRRVESRARGV